MARIFFALAMFAVVLLVANLILGFVGGDFNSAAREWVRAQENLRSAQRRTSNSDKEVREAREKLAEESARLKPVRERQLLHMLLGVAASLVTVLVNSITVTYFIGTSKWCREVVDTYRLPEELALGSQRLKRKTFPWALISILIVVCMVALGAASDPSANVHTGSQYVMLHMTVSIIGIAVITWSFLVQVANIGANYEIIEQILKLVQDARQQHAQQTLQQGGASS